MLAAECEKAWLHPGEEETMQKWHIGQEKMKKKRMRRERWKNYISKWVKQMNKSAEGSAGFLHKITTPTTYRGGAEIFKKEEEDARLLDRCEAKRKEQANH